MTDQQLAYEIAKGIGTTGVEGNYNSVSCSTAGDYPSIGISQWEGLWGGRGDTLLSYIPGGDQFLNRTYTSIKNGGELGQLEELLESAAGQEAQNQLLAADCLDMYVPALKQVPNLDDSRCFIYAGIWCPTSHNVVRRFLTNRAYSHNIRSLARLREMFRDAYYIAADVGEQYVEVYTNRAENTYQYVAGIDLTTKYGVPVYGAGQFGR